MLSASQEQMMNYYTYIHVAFWLVQIILIATYTKKKAGFSGIPLAMFSLIPFIGFIINIVGLTVLTASIQDIKRREKLNKEA